MAGRSEIEELPDAVLDTGGALFASAEPGDGFRSGAVVSSCSRYRYRLWRRWGHGARVVFIMLNPSTADASEDDPTIRRCIGFAKRWGFDGIEVVNLFPWRATDPRNLVAADKAGCDIVSRELRNDHMADAVLSREENFIVAAWGAHKLAEGEAQHLPWVCRPLHHIGVTKSGAPRHPLYVKGDTMPKRWR